MQANITTVFLKDGMRQTQQQAGCRFHTFCFDHSVLQYRYMSPVPLTILLKNSPTLPYLTIRYSEWQVYYTLDACLQAGR